VAVNYDITQGDTLTTELTVDDQDDADVNLTGATNRLRVIDRTGTQLVEITVTSHTSPTTGVTTVVIPAATTAIWPIGCFDFVSVVTLGAGTVYSIEKGTINIGDAYN